jgi:MFS family permease
MGRWTQLSLLAVAELGAMTLWFSASAVAPELSAQMSLDAGASAWLTMSVQLGFVVGALGSALTGLADRVAVPRLFAASALLGAAANAAIAFFEPGFAATIGLRFVTGACLAGVYPPGMRLMASWFVEGRGLAIGVLVGALTLGSAAPHLLHALPALLGTAMPSWTSTLFAASGFAVVASLVSITLLRDGPHLPRASRFEWRQATRLFTDRPLFLANAGYLGHMWELYAVWTWLPLLLVERWQAAGAAPAVGRLAGFAVVGIGAVGCVVAGRVADRLGRTLAAGASLVASGACCLLAGFFLDAPGALTALGLVWGFFVVADSAQFSAAVSELGEPESAGSLLTMQTFTGFVLTLFSIRLVPALADSFGWGVGLAALALGPAVGAWAMWALRRSPEAPRMAQGNR